MQQGGRGIKRVKTTRACDSCRAKKIRCEPLSNSLSSVCQQCHSHSIECTWCLPISLTRFKQRHTKQKQKQKQQEEHEQEHEHQHEHEQNDSLPRRQQKVDPRSSDHRIYGSTSMSYIMHSTRSFPVEKLGPYDSQYFQSLELEDKGEGFIKVYDQSESDTEHPQEGEEEETTTTDNSRHQQQQQQRTSSQEPSSSHHQPHKILPDEIEQLLQYYFQTISPHAPMINQQQFQYLTQNQPPQPRFTLGSSSHSKLLVYSLCGLAAMDHRVDSNLRLRVRRTIESFYRHNEILARCDIKSILSLLTIGFSLEFEIPEAGKICWNAVGTAVRMAQALGLHRPIESSRHSVIHQELRRRVWSCCIISDRWVSAVFGLPMAIDLLDSDNHPTLNDPEYILHLKQGDQLYLSHFALQSISILLGKLLKSLYTPSGIIYLKDEHLLSLMNELKEWHSRLAIITDPKNLGYLRLAAVAVEFLLFRPFMKAEHSGPKTLKFEMVAEDFDRLISRARNAIDWTSSNPYILEGQIIGQYSFFVCSLVQYHSYIGQGDLDALDTLGKAVKVIKGVQNPDCFVRNRVRDVVQALFSTAVTNRQELERARRARASQLCHFSRNDDDVQTVNQQLVHPPLTHIDHPPLTTNPFSQSTDLPAHAKLYKQPMWWWDVSVIYDMGSTLDVLSNAPFGWDGLSHPTGLINWDSPSGSNSMSQTANQSVLPAPPQQRQERSATNPHAGPQSGSHQTLAGPMPQHPGRIGPDVMPNPLAGPSNSSDLVEPSWCAGIAGLTSPAVVLPQDNSSAYPPPLATTTSPTTISASHNATQMANLPSSHTALSAPHNATQMSNLPSSQTFHHPSMPPLLPFDLFPPPAPDLHPSFQDDSMRLFNPNHHPSADSVSNQTRPQHQQNSYPSCPPFLLPP